MTFHSSRNAAQTQLDAAAKPSANGLQREQAIELAQAHIALAQAEAFHELATGLSNLAVAVARWQR
jgi:hypothetical protein